MAGTRFPYRDLFDRLFGNRRAADDALVPGAIGLQVTADDLTHLAPASQNPTYGARIFSAAVVGEYSKAEVNAAGAKALRLHGLYLSSGEGRIGLQPATKIVTAGSTYTPQQNSGERLVGVTATAKSGASSTQVLNHGYELDPGIGLMFPGLLIPKGYFFLVEGQATNTALTVSVLWEELPAEASA